MVVDLEEQGLHPCVKESNHLVGVKICPEVFFVLNLELKGNSRFYLKIQSYVCPQ